MHSESRRIVDAWWIDLEKCPPYELGAALLALLTHPTSVGASTFETIHQSICAEAIKQRARSIPEYAFSYQAIKPIHISRSETLIKRDLRTLNRRLRDRVLAGRLCNVKLALQAGKPLDLSPTIKTTSINSLIELTLDDLNSDDSENAKTRVWRESGAVVHLGAAVQAFLAQERTAERQRRALGDILFDEGALKFVTESAHSNELQIKRRAKALDMEAIADKLIPIRWGPRFK